MISNSSSYPKMNCQLVLSVFSVGNNSRLPKKILARVKFAVTQLEKLGLKLTRDKDKTFGDLDISKHKFVPCPDKYKKISSNG